MAQENDRELLHTQRLSKRFPDSAFLLLKEMYGKAIAGRDKQTATTSPVMTCAYFLSSS
jgi:hypothetical protein